MEGNIFDIRRFSTHDGDGIRTTVFLKGCPLSCVWCQNPEGISIRRRPLYFENRCIHCETCVHTCRNGGFRAEDGAIVLNPNVEEDWEKLIYHCPTGAIEMDSKTASVEEIMEEIRKDQVFYKHGGGVTLSGGEPLLQWEFAREILKQCRKEKIHTAIETALFVQTEALEAVIPYLSMAFSDLKLIDDQAHRKYVGVSNKLIKKNIEILLKSEVKDQVIIRTPMIPGITTTKENIQGIAAFISAIYPEVSYEILNYNPLAEAKYHLVDMKYCFDENPKLYSKEQMQEFGHWARQAGVKNVIIES
ncbi:MAG: glycyl-radical enzyme activating protein [Lachnospiraceae bacterium]|nr:glycyl-radical enzyme activating protein [Lachnospiraceae bacterium]